MLVFRLLNLEMKFYGLSQQEKDLLSHRFLWQSLKFETLKSRHVSVTYAGGVLMDSLKSMRKENSLSPKEAWKFSIDLDKPSFGCPHRESRRLTPKSEVTMFPTTRQRERDTHTERAREKGIREDEYENGSRSKGE